MAALFMKNKGRLYLTQEREQLYFLVAMLTYHLHSSLENVKPSLQGRVASFCHS